MTPEERAERICEFLTHNGVCLTFRTRCRTRFAIAAALHEYGDERAAVFREVLTRWYHFTPDLAQLLDGWHNDGTAWSEWDEQVRRRLSELQRETEAAIRAHPDRPAGRAEEAR